MGRVTGGIGGYAVQYVLNGGGTPIGVVSSPEKAALLHELGVEAVIDRKAAGYRFWTDEDTQDEGEWRRFGKDIRGLVGEDPDIVFEHPGRQTMGASIFVCKRGGTVVTCAATSRLHGRVRQPPLLDEAEAAHRLATSPTTTRRGTANRLISQGRIQPLLSAVLPARGDGRGGPPHPPQRARGQDRRPVPRSRRRASASTTPSAGPQIGEDKITLFPVR